MNIEQALAEALQVLVCGHSIGAECGWSDDGECKCCEKDAAAILATPQMQAIARQAAIGAAVERLKATGREWSIEARPLTYHVWAGVFGFTKGIDADLLAAIAAALGEDDDVS